ncbi:MAG: anthranilate synthase component I family protein [Clostridia bacterium]|nr:anthranilate synthase component I family protein [Clostridia bacterium]
MYPTFDKIREMAAAGDYKRIPICKELYADSYTPVEMMRILQKASHHCYLLESASQNEVWGRYSFLGYDPSMEITCTDGILRIRRTDELFENKTDALNTEKAEPKKTDALVNGKTRTNEADSLHDKKAENNVRKEKKQSEEVMQVTHPGDAIRKIIQQYKSPVMDNMPTFTGGLVGYFSYDYIKYSEPKLDLTDAEQQDFRDLDLMLFNEVIAFDHYRQKVLLITGVMTDNLDESYKRACEKLEEMTRLIQKGEKKEFPPICLKSEIQPQFPKEKYCEMVEKAKHYIHEGDIFQVVLSNPMRAKATGSLFDTYRVLRATNPSPYMFYFSSDDIEIAGASPETLAKLEHGKLSTFPLAGTRPRGKTPQEDKALEADLLQDEKELAEHNMLVDLGRNDIGKISRLGSVKVEKYLTVERYSCVMHLGSTVTGTIADGRDAIDAVDAILPAGTLSGAPKFRACQIIQELEQSKRGIYGGAIGYVDFTGNLDVCIAIRLVYKKKDEICIRSGAGIVADSVPEKEFEECQNKARAVVRAISQAEEGLE